MRWCVQTFDRHSIFSPTDWLAGQLFLAWLQLMFFFEWCIWTQYQHFLVHLAASSSSFENIIWPVAWLERNGRYSGRMQCWSRGLIVRRTGYYSELYVVSSLMPRAAEASPKWVPDIVKEKASGYTTQAGSQSSTLHDCHQTINLHQPYPWSPSSDQAMNCLSPSLEDTCPQRLDLYRLT